MFRVFARKRLTWLIAFAALLMAIAMSLGYLGAFLNPETSIRDFPIGIVNEDDGVSVLGQDRNTGEEILTRVTAADAPTAGKVEWVTYGTRDELVAAMEANDVYAGIVVPSDFTADLASIMYPQLGAGSPQQATLEVLYNHGGGSIAASNGVRITSEVVAGIQQQIAAQVTAAITADTVPADMVSLYAAPVQVTQTDLVPAVDHTGAGMAPTYVAIVVTVGGLLAATILNLGIDFLAGHGSLGPRLEKLRGEASPATLRQMFVIKAALLILVSLLGGAVTTFIATGWLEMPVSNTWTFYAMVVLGMLAAGGPTLAFIALLGTPGVLLGLILTTILGVPSSGGVFPHEMMPKFYTWTGFFAPVRYLYDSFRSLVFFDGRAAAGMSTWWVVALYGIGGIVIGYVFSALVQWSRGRHTAPVVTIESDGQPAS